MVLVPCILALLRSFQICQQVTATLIDNLSLLLPSIYFYNPSNYLLVEDILCLCTLIHSYHFKPNPKWPFITQQLAFSRLLMLTKVTFSRGCNSSCLQIIVYSHYILKHFPKKHLHFARAFNIPWSKVHALLLIWCEVEGPSF